MRSSVTSTALLAAFALALGACGGDDGGSPSEQAQITKPEYVKQVDAICADTVKRSQPTFDKLQDLVNASGTYKSRLIKAAPLLRRAYRLQASKLRRFKAIEPPAADRAQIAELTTVAEKTIDEFRSFLPAAERGDLEEFIDIATDASGARGDAERLGTNYGFDESCFSLPVDLSNVT